jgi:signal peptide peptidase SppA
MTDTTTAMLAMLPGAPGEAQLLGAISGLPAGAYITAPAKRETAGYRLQGPVAVIEIFGALAHHTGWMWSYQDIAGWLNDALKNPAVKAIVLSIDSPGGLADGCAQLGEQIVAARSVKPIHACVNDMAASAGYWIASAAEKISATKTSRVGSIGVRAMHIDMSKMLADIGYKVTEIYAGAHKIAGTPYAPLGPEALAAFQSSIDYTYGLFVSAVAANRNLDRAAVIATQAAMFDPPAAKKAGLIDAIETPDAVISRLAARYAARPAHRAAARISRSSTVSQDPDRYVADSPSITQAQLDAARAEGQAAGVAEGRKAERARLAAVLSLPEAEGREAQARQIALTTELDPATCAAILAAAPKVESPPPAAKSEFAAHMDALGNPKIGPDSQAAVQTAVDNIWNYAFDQQRRAGGRKD